MRYNIIKWMAKMQLLTAFFLICTTGFGAILPADRTITWNPGVRGGVPNISTRFCDITALIPGTNIVAIGDGVTDNKNAFNAASKLCPTNQYVYIPDGVYISSGTISITNHGIVFRGQSTNAIVRFTGPTGGDGFSIGSNNGTTSDVLWTANFTKGSSNLTLASISGMAVGQIVAVATSNNVPNGALIATWPLFAVANSNNAGSVDTYLGYKNGRYSLAHLARITAVGVSGALDITVDPALPIDYTNNAGVNNRIFKFNPFTQRVGLESFTIDNSSSVAYAGNTVAWYEVNNCWMTNMKTLNAASIHTRWTKALSCSFIGNTVRGAFSYGPNSGYGLELYLYSTANLIENNIFERCLNAVQMVASSQNVISYNFTTNQVGPNTFDRMSFDMAGNHGAHNCMNLFEGNKGDKFFADAIHGSSSHMVLLRDWFRGWGTNNASGSNVLMTYAACAIELAWGNRFGSIVGCVLGTTNIDPAIGWRSVDYMQIAPPAYSDFQNPGIYRMGCFNSASASAIGDTNVLFTAIILNNHTTSTNGPYVIAPAEVSAESIPNSYYLSSKPSWFGSLTWPPIGSDLANNRNIIPAEARYYNLSAGPVLTVPSDSSLNELTAYSATASSTGSGLVFSLDSAPSGMSINSSSGLISWTPTEAQGPGTFTVTVRVTDGSSLTDTKSFTLTVNEVNLAPTLTIPSNATINELAAYTATASATDPDLPDNILTFSLTTSPSGMAIDSLSGLITWTPTEAQGPGTYTVTVRVTDNGSGSLYDEKTYTLTVDEVNSAPVLPSPSNATITARVLYTLTNPGSDVDLPANTLTYSLDEYPTGLAIDSSTGTITWTPTTDQANVSYTVKAVLTDGIVNVTNSFVLTVELPPISIYKTVMNWSRGETIGNLNGITNRSSVFCNVKTSIPGSPLVAIGDGVTDDTDALIAAARLCTSNKVVYLPAGTYRLKSTWAIAANQSGLPYVNNITFRGAGKGVTKIYSDITNGSAGASAAISIGSSYWGITGPFKSGSGSVSVSSNLPSGLYSITLASIPTNVLSGGSIWIDELNDNSIVTSYGSDTAYLSTATPSSVGNIKAMSTDRPLTGTRNHFHIAQVTNITGTTISFTPPIPVGFLAARSPIVTGVIQNRNGLMYGHNIGFEDMTFLENTNNNKLGRYFDFNGSVNNFITGCSFSNITKVAIKLTATVGFELLSNDFDNRYISQTAGSSVGITTLASSGFNIENNCFYKYFTPYINYLGTYGAILYNAIIDTKSPGNLGRQSVDININHGSHSTCILVEGNILNSIQADSSQGSGGNFTIYGNYIHGSDLGVTNGRVLIKLDSLNYTNLISGNWLGAGSLSWSSFPVNKSYNLNNNYIYRFGYPAQYGVTYVSGSNFQLAYNSAIEPTTLRHGNRDASNNNTVDNYSEYSSVLPPSLTSNTNKPSYWGVLSWPPYVSATSEPNKTNSIPALKRFFP